MSKDKISKTHKQLLDKLHKSDSFSNFYLFLNIWQNETISALHEYTGKNIDLLRNTYMLLYQDIAHLAMEHYSWLVEKWAFSDTSTRIISINEILPLIKNSKSSKYILPKLDELFSANFKQFYVRRKLSEVIFSFTMITAKEMKNPLFGVDECSKVFSVCFEEPFLFFHIDQSFIEICEKYLERFEDDAIYYANETMGNGTIPIFLSFAEGHALTVAGIRFLKGLKYQNPQYFQEARESISKMYNFCTSDIKIDLNPVLTLNNNISLISFLNLMIEEKIEPEKIERMEGDFYKFQFNNRRYCVSLAYRPFIIVHKNDCTSTNIRNARDIFNKDIYSALLLNKNIIRESVHVYKIDSFINMCTMFYLDCSIENSLKYLWPKVDYSDIKDIYGHLHKELSSTTELGLLVTCTDFVISYLVCGEINFKNSIKDGLVMALVDLYLKIRSKID